jgi:phosphatidylserine decarboxylase
MPEMNDNADLEIQIFNRRTRRMEKEMVYGRGAMDIFYGTRWGRRLTAGVLCRPFISKLYGRIQEHPWSRRQIPSFIRQYHIDMNDVIVPSGGFSSFNAFFTRQLKPSARPMDPDPQRLIAPADSRLQVFPVQPNLSLAIKGMHVTLPRLLGRSRLDSRFQKGLCLCFRLAPCDYHRFGYVDHGRQGPVHTIKGPLHSVSPLALRHRKDILGTNFRQWCFIASPVWGTLIQVEVGAMMVGSIVQHQPRGGPCQKGREKGYFQFGGSTVLLILEPDRVEMDDDIRRWSDKGVETLVKYGEAIGTTVKTGTTS